MPCKLLPRIAVISLLLMSAISAVAIGEKDEDDSPAGNVINAGAALIVNEEGGPISISGDLHYTNAFFTSGVAEPLIILEEQTGFIDRNQYFIIPLESQVPGQITSDFYTSPFSYSVSLPLAPAGSLRDVDNDGEDDSGVMVFAVAYWTNLFGGPLLEKCDQHGGGWSTGYASTRASIDPGHPLGNRGREVYHLRA